MVQKIVFTKFSKLRYWSVKYESNVTRPDESWLRV